MPESQILGKYRRYGRRIRKVAEKYELETLKEGIEKALDGIAMNKPESFEKAAELLESRQAVETAGKYLGKVRGEVISWIIGDIAKEKPESFDRALELLGSNKTLKVLAKYEYYPGAAEEVALAFGKIAKNKPEIFESVVDMVGKYSRHVVKEVLGAFGEVSRYEPDALEKTAEFLSRKPAVNLIENYEDNSRRVTKALINIAIFAPDDFDKDVKEASNTLNPMLEIAKLGDAARKGKKK
jgi:hypothetical protein